MSKTVNIDEFLELTKTHAILDVRTPAEFEKGHIPGAINLPLFTNEERVIVGTIYKKEGRQPAILKGLELVGPKLRSIVEEAQKHTKDNCILTHCWRGGMRSGSVAWLLETYGIKVYTLKGGYKFFRRKIISTFEKQYNLFIIGGRTGSSKSKVIHALKKKNIQLLDLEKLAHHKGSSYGHLGEETAPSQEMFENLLGCELLKCDPVKKIILEDESRMVGQRAVPNNFYLQMRESNLLYLDVSFEDRVKYLSVEYGKFDQDALIEATTRIEKRLGSLQTKNACIAIGENKMEEACRIILAYYDKAYDYGLSQRDPKKITRMEIEKYDASTLQKIEQLITKA
jgi:tRNA 2-selenouridine synthase